MFRERLHKGYAQSMELTGVVAEERSRYQAIKIFDTVANGRVMVLDDIVQITTRDESAYAEMLTHLPLLEHGKGERVMIVGGGDLSIADEALKHRSVKEVVLVDIDGRVVELCREHFGAINAKAFKDKRLTIEIADAFEYLGRKEAKARFDLYKRGFTKVPHLIEVGERLFGAEVDLYDKPEDRARVLQRQLDVYNEAEGNLEKQVKEGLAPQADLERLRYNKASLEIDLLSAKSGLSQPHPAPQPSPQ